MKRFLKSFSLLLCSSLLAMTGWAETIVVNQETIGINFTTSGKLMSADSTEEWGYYSQEKSQGGLLAENKWQNFTSTKQIASYDIQTAGNPNLSIQLKKTTANETWGPSSTNKLLGAYLDNGSTLEFYGLPASGYDVAIIFAGDGGKFSRVTVNGTDKTYNANGELVNGTSSWGDRTQSANDLKQLTATGTATAGQVMYLANLNAETLKLQTVSDQNNIDVGRGTIAAIQIYLKPGLFKKPSPVWTWDGAGGTATGDSLPSGATVYTVNGYTTTVENVPAKNFTFSFWTKRAGSSWRDVAGFANATGAIGLERGRSDALWFYGTAQGQGPDGTDVGFELSNDTLQMVTLVVNNGVITTYVNGSQVAYKCEKNEAAVSGNPTTLTVASWSDLTDESAMMTRFGLGCQPTSSASERGADATIADVRIYNVALSDAQVEALYNSYYPLSMAADTDGSGALSWDEITAVVGNRTTWDVSGDVKISLDADIDPALTALTLNPVNVSGDKLTITGTGSLYGDGSTFALTTEIPVDITNQKNNPTITLSGAGNVTIRKGAQGGGIAPVANNYTGTFTVDGGQQITRMDGDLTIPFTVGEGGAKLHSNSSDWTVSSKISGSGTLTIESPDRTIYVTSNTTDFSGDVILKSGTLYLDKGKGSVGNVFNNANTTLTVKSGAIFKTHLTQNGTSDYSRGLILEPGAQVINHDGHMNYNGGLVVNNGGDANSTSTYQLVYNKTADFKGVISGKGTLNLTVENTQYSPHTVKISNENNTFSGTYHINPNKGDYTQLILEANGKMDDASVKMSKGQFKLVRDNTSIVSLSGTAGTVTSNDSTERTLTLNGDSDVRNLTFTNVNLVIASGETFITPITKATVGAGAKVKVVLTADQKLTGLELANVTVNEGGTVVFLDIDGTTELQSSESNAYEAAQTSTYTVTAEGGSWNKDPEDGDAITIAFGDITNRTLDESILPQGVTHLVGLTTTGANASVTATFAAIADAVIVEDTLAIVGTAEEATIAGVISGAGKVKVAAGLVKFTNTNTYTGGTDIAANATLIMSNANAIGTTGNITGAGTLKFSQFVPANLNGLTTGSAASDETPASGWTGTFYMMNRLSSGTFPVNEWGNANSTVCFENCSGYLTPADGTTVVPNIRVEGDGWRSQNGNGNAQFTFTGALTGSGKLEVATNAPSAGNFYKFTGDVSKFAGYVNVENNHRVVFGDADSQGNGKITIAKDVTIAAQKTWSAVNGIAIMDGTTLTVNGAITGAIANAGILTYGVDTTASNTIFGAGAIQVATAKIVDLSAATLTNFTGTYVVGEGATLKLPLTATADKDIALGTDAKLLVVLNDEQKGAEQSVTVTGGSVQFVDANGNVLCDGASYSMPTYTVGKGWTGANRFAGANIVIDFAETTEETVDLTAILGSVTTLSKLTVTGSKGGTITDTNTTVTACTEVVVTAGGRTNVPASLTSLATTVTGPTTEGSLLYVTGETTTTEANFPYSGNRHFETIKFSIRQMGGNIENYTVAANETLQFTNATEACYIKDLTLNGGFIKSDATNLVWLGGYAESTFTLNSGKADFSSVITDSGSSALLIGYSGGSHSFDIKGGELDASNTSIVVWEANSAYRQSGGIVKTKGFRQNGSNFTEMTLTGGTIELGAGGIPNLSMESISFGGATIHAVADNTVAEALNMTAGATLSAAEGKTMKVTSAITGTATLSIAGVGTVDLSGATIANTIALNVADGATVVVSADQLSAFAKVIVPEGATLKVKLTVDCLISGRLNCTLGAESTLDGAIVLDGIEGETTTFTDGVLSVTFAANPTLTGNAWWWDYEFNGTLDNSGTDTAESLTPRGDADSYTNDNQELYIQKSPWRDATFSNVDEFTAVMYCQPGAGDAYNNRPLIAFGTKTGVAVILATGANAADGDMQILLNRNNNITSLVDKLRVPTATTAKHLYAFTFAAQENKTVISVYVDGKLKKTTTVNERFHVTDGFQIGAVHGGQVGELVEYPQSGNLGTIDFLRVTKEILSADAMRALAEVYKYESANGEATRTIEGEEPITTTWVAESTWTQSGKDAPVNQPNNGTNVTLTANVATEVMVNLEEAVTYETVTVAGNAAVTFKKGTATFSAGDITIGTDVTIEYGAIDVDSLIVNGGKTLTFDFTDYDFNSIYASTTIPLTGLATLGENATVTVALPTLSTLPAYLTAECVFDASKSEYALAITVTGSLSAVISQDCTWDEVRWKMGDVVVTRPADLSAFATIPVVLTKNATLTLESAVSLNAVTVSGGTLTIAGAELTVTSLTLNNADVNATTLRASAVTGTVGTERLTMTLGAGDYTRAMALSNCAFTKAGAGTLKLGVAGTEMNDVEVTLAGGMLSLEIQGGVDPQIEDVTFIYVDANEDGIADGELTNWGWVHSESSVTFDVPAGVTGKAFVASNSNLTGACAVVKQGAGALELGIKTTPYTGATTLSEGTLSYHASDACTVQSAISVAANAAIKGSSRCTLASLSFADGAVIDATNGPVTATAVTLPEGEGTVAVRMTSHGEVLKTTGLVLEKFAVEGEGIANCSLMLTQENSVLAYVATPVVENVAVPTEVMNVIIQEAADVGITNVTIEGITLAEDEEGNPVKTASVEGLELFDNIPRTIVPGSNGAGKVILDYVFGISDITVNAAGNIIVKASVDSIMDYSVAPIDDEGGATPAEPVKPTFVNGVEVELLNGEDVIGEAEVEVDNASEITITSDDTVAAILNDGVGTLDLTVKVKGAQASETPEGGEEEVTPAE